MTDPTDQQSGSTFVPEPISIHTIDEAAYRKCFDGVMTPRMAVLAVVFLVAGGVLVFWPLAGGLGIVVVAAVAIGVTIVVLLMVVAQFYLNRWWQLKLWRATRIELWPDCIIRRIEGRPPLVIRKEDVASIWVKKGVPRRLVVRSKRGFYESMGIPAAVIGFEELCERVRAWGVPESWGAWSYLRHPSFVFGVVMPLAAFYGAMEVDNPVLVTVFTLITVSGSALFAWRLWTGRHRDKWTRRLVWLIPVFLAVFLGMETFEKWLQYYDVPFQGFMRPIFLWL